MSRGSALLAVAVVVLAAGLSGCNAARFVNVAPGEGVVAIPCNSDTWPYYHRSRAEELMAKHCPQGYEVVREEEVVTGTTEHTHTNVEKTGNPLLAAVHIAPVNERTNQTTTYQNQTEWRIFFRARQQ